MYPTLSFASMAVLASSFTISSAAFTYLSCQPTSAINLANFGTGSTSVFNSVGQCGVTCAASPFMALQQNKCLCIPSFTATTSSADKLCNEPCPGFPSDTCGSSNTFYSLYANGNSNSTASNSSSSATFTATGTLYSTGTSVAAATGVAGNASTSAKPTAGPTSTPVSGAGNLGAEALKILVAVGGVMALL